MEVSETVDALVTLLETYAPEGLRERDTMAALLQHGYNAQETARIGEMAFLGKYLWKVFGKLKQESPESDAYGTLESEFSRAVHEFHGHLSALVVGTDDAFRQGIEQQYLGVSEASLKQLLALAHDFNWLKNWELEMSKLEQESGE